MPQKTSGRHGPQRNRTTARVPTMINNSRIDQYKRMESKRLDQVFLTRLRHGLGCSPFEADAVLRTHHDVYGALQQLDAQPGQFLVSVVSAEAPPQASLEEAQQVLVRLTLDATGDLDVRRRDGVVGLRRLRLQRMAREAFDQGGLLTVEDLALRLLNCGERTLNRDLADLRAEGIEVPLRSTIKDMGRSVSHRSVIVNRWLRGEEYAAIAKATCHSVRSVQAYVSCFRRIAVLHRKTPEKELVPFLAGVSPTLAREYLEILKTAKMSPHRRKEIDGAAKKK